MHGRTDESFIAAMFGRMDADGDGALRPAELAAGHDAAMGGG